MLLDHVRRLAKQPERLAGATDFVLSLVDTWPLGALIDDARRRWTDGPDPAALAVLVRATEVIGPVLGWPRSLDRRWPMPDEAWMRAQVGDQPAVVVPRGPRDGSSAAIVALEVPRAPSDPLSLPPTLTAHAERLSDDADALYAALERGEIVAVHLEGVVPDEPDALCARERLREASPAQAALDWYGLAGLAAGAHVAWADTLGTAPAGQPGPKPQRVCDALVLPWPGRAGQAEDRGVLAWDGPYAPVWVHADAIKVLGRLDGQTSIEEVAAAVHGPVSLVERIVGELIALGAATAQ